MAELTQQERLQPCLLDRITDDAPEKKQESRDQRVVSLRRLREGVLRDLGWLLNATNMAVLEDLTDYPHVARSVLNYGMPGLAGTLVSSIDVVDVVFVVPDGRVTDAAWAGSPVGRGRFTRSLEGVSARVRALPRRRRLAARLEVVS